MPKPPPELSPLRLLQYSLLPGPSQEDEEATEALGIMPYNGESVKDFLTRVQARVRFLTRARFRSPEEWASGAQGRRAAVRRMRGEASVQALERSLSPHSKPLGLGW